MAGIPTKTTNFDKTFTALVMRTVEENARRKLKWLMEGDFRHGTLIPGTNLIRYIAYGDIPVNSATLDTDYAVIEEGKPNFSVDLSIGYDEFGAKQRMKTIRLTDVSMDMNPH